MPKPPEKSLLNHRGQRISKKALTKITKEIYWQLDLVKSYLQTAIKRKEVLDYNNVVLADDYIKHHALSIYYMLFGYESGMELYTIAKNKIREWHLCDLYCEEQSVKDVMNKLTEVDTLIYEYGQIKLNKPRRRGTR